MKLFKNIANILLCLVVSIFVSGSFVHFDDLIYFVILSLIIFVSLLFVYRYEEKKELENSKIKTYVVTAGNG